MEPPQPEPDPLHRARELYDEGLYSDAEDELIRALANGAPPAAAYRLLADVEHRLNNPAREARALEQALAAGASAPSSRPEHIWTRLGAIRASLGDAGAAVAAYQQAIRIAPDKPAARYGIAMARLANQDFDGARQVVEDLQLRFPEIARTHLLAGHVHKAFGNAARAAECYRRALDGESTLGEALYNLVEMAPPAPDDSIAARAAEIVGCKELPAADRVNAGFALARIHDRAGRYAKAFEHARCANGLARDSLSARGIDYMPDRAERRTARIIADYPACSFGAGRDPLPVEFTPVFIIGLPRSGTTLIEQILASHPSVQAAGERVFARRCERTFRDSRAAAGRKGPIDPANDIDAKLLEVARERYLEDVLETGLEGPWVVDKLPANFEIAGFLRLMLPEAVLIHSVRDAPATCFSLYWANFSSHEPWYHDLGHLAHYYREYHRLVTHWRAVIPGPFIDVVYEDLVRNPRNETAGLLRRVGLSFDPACAEFYTHERPILTASHAQVRKPVTTDAIDHWRHYAEWIGPIRGPAMTTDT